MATPRKSKTLRYSILHVAQTCHSVMPVFMDAQGGSKFNSPDAHSEKTQRHMGTKTPIEEWLTSNRLTDSQIQLRRRILKCHRPSLCRKKNVTPHIIANGYVCIAFWFSAWNLQNKNTNKIGVLPPPQTHTLSKIFTEVSSGPEINTFITDNRHLIKKKNKTTTLSISVCTNLVSRS